MYLSLLSNPVCWARLVILFRKLYLSSLTTRSSDWIVSFLFELLDLNTLKFKAFGVSLHGSLADLFVNTIKFLNMVSFELSFRNGLEANLSG